MTTVAADLRTGKMAADTMVSDGAIRTRMQKVVRHGDALIGVAGGLEDIQTWLRWYRGGRKGTKPKVSNVSALVLTKDTLMQWHGATETECEHPFIAIGSGGMAAMACMHLGHSVEEAVRAAAEVDPDSCAPIQVECLNANCKDSATV